MVKVVDSLIYLGIKFAKSNNFKKPAKAISEKGNGRFILFNGIKFDIKPNLLFLTE